MSIHCETPFPASLCGSSVRALVPTIPAAATNLVEKPSTEAYLRRLAVSTLQGYVIEFD